MQLHHLLIILIALAIPSVAHADDPVGVAHYQARNYEAALAAFDAAIAKEPTAKLELWRARTLTALGRLIAALDAYTAISGGDPDTMARAVEERQDVDERIPELSVALIGAAAGEVSLSYNGQATTQARFDPGPFEIRAVHRDGRTIIKRIHLTERDRARVVINFTVPPQPEDRGAGQRIAGWVAIGIGSAAFAAGAVIGAIAIGKLAEADCPDDKCPPDQFDEADAYNELREPSGFLMFGGAMTALLGIGLIAAAPDAPDSPELAVGPGYIRGAF